jgi:hypothetical protein
MRGKRAKKKKESRVVETTELPPEWNVCCASYSLPHTTQYNVYSNKYIHGIFRSSSAAAAASFYVRALYFIIIVIILMIRFFRHCCCCCFGFHGFSSFSARVGGGGSHLGNLSVVARYVGLFIVCEYTHDYDDDDADDDDDNFSSFSAVCMRVCVWWCVRFPCAFRVWKLLFTLFGRVFFRLVDWECQEWA